MTTIETISAVVGQALDSDEVQSLVVADRLTLSAEPELEEGEPRRFYLSNHAAGYQLMYRLGRIDTAFIYVQPAEGFQPFGRPLPAGLSSEATRHEVRRQFGSPSRSGAARIVAGLGRQGAWDRFDMGQVCLHFQYAEPDERVRLVTIMTAETAP
jgi:hypothetical protein